METNTFPPQAQQNITSNADPLAALDPYIQPELQEEKYGTLGQQAITGLESAASTATLGIAPGVERAFGVNPEDIRARQETNPIVSGIGSVAGLLTPGGAGEAIGAAGVKAAEALGLGAEGATLASQIGGHAARAATEMALIQSGDEVSKMMLSDPDQTAQTALSNIGLSALLGAGGGAAIGSISPLWQATFGNKLGQEIANFKGRIAEHIENPNPVDAIKNELTDYYKSVSDVADSVYGPKGLKAQEIQKLMPEMNDTIIKKTSELGNGLLKTIEEMKADPETYDPRLVRQYEKQTGRILDALTDPETSPGKIFDAVQTTKQWAQDIAKSSWDVKPFNPEYDAVKKISALSKDLRPFLEDPEIWGKAGERQQAINKAFTEYKPALEDFEKKFTEKQGGERIISPGKIQTYVNQLGKPTAEIKQSMLRDFLDASQKYTDVIGASHANLGIESPFQPTGLNVTRRTLDQLTPGEKAADILIKKGLAGPAGMALGAGVGGALGHTVGASGFGALIGEHALGPFFSSILPTITKPILSGFASAEGTKAAAEYGMNVIKGEQLIDKSTKNIFNPGVEVLGTHLLPSDKEKKRLDDKVAQLSETPQSLIDMGGHIGKYLPNHTQAMTKTAMTAVQILAQLKPKEQKQMAFDTKFPAIKSQQAAYDRALTIAEQPLSVLNHVKSGTVSPQDVQLFSSMYPDLYKKVSQKIYGQIAEMKHKEETLPYKTRLGLSLFLGEPLDSTMTPNAIQTLAQSRTNPVMTNQEAQQTRAPHSMKDINKIAQSWATPQQAREVQRGKV